MMHSWQDVNWQDPLADHPLNVDRSAWWLNVPHWKGGTVWRDLTGIHDGTLNSMAPASDWIQSVRGWGALSLDGSNDRIEMAGPNAAWIEHLNNFTWAGWFSITGAVAQYDVAMSSCDSNGFGVRLWTRSSSSYKWYFEVNDGQVENTISATSIGGGWQHVVGTHDGTNINIYINGQLEGTPEACTDVNYGAALNDVKNQIGCMRHSTGIFQRFMPGDYDDIGIWARALTPGEVADLYTLSLQGYPGVLNRPKLRAMVPAAAGGLSIPVAMANYRRQHQGAMH